MKIFRENLTSKILQQKSSSIINKYRKEIDILEIGCGDGNITNFAISKRKIDHNFYLSDVSNNAVSAAKKRIKYKKCKFKSGKWLNPWKDKKFDIIVSNVSSINDFIANKSPWYKPYTVVDGVDI